MALCYVIIIKSLYPHSPKGEGVYCFYTPTPRKGRGVYCFTSVCPSVQDIFRRIFLSNCWWQKSDIWSQASYRYAILWEAVLDPSDSYFLFADFVDFYTHWTYMFIFIHIEHICSFYVTFFSATIDGRNLIFGHKLHIGTPYRGKCFWTHQIRTSCLPILLIFIHILKHTFVYASSHFSMQLLLTGIWYLVTSFI